MEDWDFVLKIAVFTVGVTQVLKLVFSDAGTKVKVLITVLVGAAGGAMLVLLPQEVFLTATGIALAVAFYDSLLSYIRKKIEGLER